MNNNDDSHRRAPQAQQPAPAAGEQPAAFEAALAAIDGLDLPAALRGVGGRIALLERILRKFVTHYGSSAWTLPEPTGADTLPALGAACHALRGACATIGAQTLARSLHDLEVATAAPAADLAALHRAVADARHQLQRLVDGLNAALAR